MKGRTARARRGGVCTTAKKREAGPDWKALHAKIGQHDLPDFFGPLIPGKRLPDWVVEKHCCLNAAGVCY